MLNPQTHSDTYPDSYYHATLNDKAGFPQAKGNHQTKVCVIGGGLSGVNTALELVERGIDVVLLEAYKIGWGASGRNGGQLIRGIGHGLDQFKNVIGDDGIATINSMGFEAVDIARQRIEKYKIDCDLKWGYCDLATKKRHLKDFAEDKAWLDSIGYRYETKLVDESELQNVVGSDVYIGGLIDMGSGHLHPLKLNIAEARAAEHLGAKIFENSKVVNISKGSRCTIETEQATIECDTLVICGNAYVGDLDDTLGGQVLPAGSYILATEPLSDDEAMRVLPQDMAVCDQRVDLDYYRLSKEKRLLFGGLCTFSGRDPKSIIHALKPNLDKVFPYLAHKKIDYAWGGMIGIGANRLPQIGRLADNIFYAQAYSGHGLNATHMAGRLIAETIANESQRIEVFERITHLRFPGGRKFRSPMLAAGMLYHRAKDLF